jgi:hypothetical protein
MNASTANFLRALAVIAFTLPASAKASAPAGRYVVTAGGTVYGTVYDTKTRLTWQQAVSSTTYTWADAETHCVDAGVRLGGSGWRVPTVKELQTIVDYSQSSGPMIDPTAFPSTPASVFWSSSPVAGSTSLAWLVSFYGGYSNSYDVSYAFNVRCVR